MDSWWERVAILFPHTEQLYSTSSDCGWAQKRRREGEGGEEEEGEKKERRGRREEGKSPNKGHHEIRTHCKVKIKQLLKVSLLVLHQDHTAVGVSRKCSGCAVGVSRKCSGCFQEVQ